MLQESPSKSRVRIVVYDEEQQERARSVCRCGESPTSDDLQSVRFGQEECVLFAVVNMLEPSCQIVFGKYFELETSKLEVRQTVSRLMTTLNALERL